MDWVEFSVWLTEIGRLTLEQRDAAMERLRECRAEVCGAPTRLEPPPPPEETTAAAVMAARRGRLEGGPASADLDEVALRRIEAFGCPHCGGRELTGWGRANGSPRWRCNGCKRTFNALTKTPMAGLRKKESWFEHGRAMIEGTSLAVAAARCDIHPSTAHRWRHRFLGAPSLNKPRALAGVVEADETFVLESYKGRREGLPRPARKRGGKAAKRGLSREQIPILVARDRAGATTDAVLPALTAADIAEALDGVVTPANMLVCDGGAAICAFARRAKIPFHAVPAPGKPRREAPQMHINNVNAYHGRFKEWMRRFHGVATKNLPNYLGWRRAMEAWGESLDETKWLLGAIDCGPYQ